MKQNKWLLTAAFIGLGMVGLVAFAPQAHAKCSVTLEIKNGHNKDLNIKEAHVKYKNGGGNWIGIRSGTKTRTVKKGGSLKITFTHIPDCKRKKKIKLKFYTKTVNNLKTHTTGSWAKGKKLTMTWKGERNFTYAGNK